VLVGCVLYFTIGYIVHRTRLRGRRILDILAILPIAIPGIIIGLGYLWSWITLPIGLYGTLWIIILAYVSQFAPQGVRAISTSLVQIHPELEESSRLSGAGFLYTLRRVVVPLAWPGILAAMILLLVLSFRELATALFLYTSNTQVFSLTMFDFWLRGSTGLVAVMALLQSVILLVLVIAGQRLRREPASAQSPAPPRG
jgi:iron(III) transport system permease protein